MNPDNPHLRYAEPRARLSAALLTFAMGAAVIVALAVLFSAAFDLIDWSVI